MADNLTTQSATPATVPALTVIATDDASGAHYQLVKLVNATADSTTRTGVAADPLRVDPTGTTAQPVKPDTASSATVTQVSSSASSTTLQALNASRKALYIFNDSTQVLYVKLGATASATSYTVQIPSGGYWEMPNRPTYTGVVDGIWASANGNAYVTEL